MMGQGSPGQQGLLAGAWREGRREAEIRFSCRAPGRNQPSRTLVWTLGLLHGDGIFSSSFKPPVCGDSP